MLRAESEEAQNSPVDILYFGGMEGCAVEKSIEEQIDPLYVEEQIDPSYILAWRARAWLSARTSHRNIHS
jgi:hypothetical protein